MIAVGQPREPFEAERPVHAVRKENRNPALATFPSTRSTCSTAECCGIQQADASSGWELIHGLRSWDPRARAVSAALLAKTEHARLLTRDLRRAERGPRKTRTARTQLLRQPRGEVVGMNTPYGLEIIESCLTCKLRKDKWFCGLSPDVLKSFSAASHLEHLPGRGFAVRRRPDTARSLCAVLGQSEAFHDLARG